MPSVSDDNRRHVVVDKRDGEYLCFPDVALADDGRLLVVYNGFNRHVGTRRTVLLSESMDGGRNWSLPRHLNAAIGHCPRISRLNDGSLFVIDDSGGYMSLDNGKNWGDVGLGDFLHSIRDRVIELDHEHFLSTGHLHRGTYPQPGIGQAPTEQMVYISENRGKTWKALSVLSNDRHLTLCEASMVRLPHGGLLALMRENSAVYEPMYACLSQDNGRTWSNPKATPLVGHRPTVGMTRNGRLMVTYRDVGPDHGTAAWTGTEEELLSGFAPQGRLSGPDSVSFTSEGMVLRTTEGPGGAARFALRPITNPLRARAELEVELRVDRAMDQAVGLHFGLWWRIGSDYVAPMLEDMAPIAIEPGRMNTLRFVFSSGVCTLSVDGEDRAVVPVDASRVEARPILAGCVNMNENNAGESVWKRMGLSIEEPRYGREYSWVWNHTMGTPDQYARDHILELKNARHLSGPDFGYSGWVEADPGEFFCVYHHADIDGTSYVMGTRFRDNDFRRR